MDTGGFSISNSEEQTPVTAVCTTRTLVSLCPSETSDGCRDWDAGAGNPSCHTSPGAQTSLKNYNKSKKELAELLKFKNPPVISHYSQHHTGKQPMFSKYYQEPRNVKISKIGKSDKTGSTGNQLSQDTRYWEKRERMRS